MKIIIEQKAFGLLITVIAEDKEPYQVLLMPDEASEFMASLREALEKVRTLFDI